MFELYDDYKTLVKWITIFDKIWFIYENTFQYQNIQSKTAGLLRKNARNDGKFKRSQ